MTFQYIVEEQDSGKRVDSYVSEKCEKISRSLAQKALREQKILLDGKTAKASEKVKVGQVIEILDENITEEANQNIKAENISLDILYEDEDVLLVNKPKNMVVHPAVRKPFRNFGKCGTRKI